MQYENPPSSPCRLSIVLIGIEMTEQIYNELQFQLSIVLIGIEIALTYALVSE